MKTNIVKLRIVRNAFEVEKEPRMDDWIIFQGQGEITKKTESNNQDGTVNAVYDLKPSLLEIKSIDARKDDVTISKDFIKDKSRAQAHRSLLFKLWSERGAKGSFESFYNTYYDERDRVLQEKIDKEVMGY